MLCLCLEGPASLGKNCFGFHWFVKYVQFDVYVLYSSSRCHWFYDMKFSCTIYLETDANLSPVGQSIVSLTCS